MDSEKLENMLRPYLQGIGIMGKRGPAKGHVLPLILAAILALVGIVAIIVNVVEYVFLKKCPMCGEKQHEQAPYFSKVSRITFK